MKPIILPNAELRTALVGLGKIIHRRTTLPVLSTVNIGRAMDGQVSLTATDLDCSATVTLEEKGEREAVSLLVPYPELTKVSRRCGTSDVLSVWTEETASGLSAVIAYPAGAQTVQHRCESLPVEEFPPVPEVRSDAIALGDPIRMAIREALACSSDDPTRLILNGAFIDVSEPKGHHVIGTDGRHLFSSNSFRLPLKNSVILPAHPFLEWKPFHDDGDWSLGVKAEKDVAPQVEISSAHWRFFTRSPEGTYPNWRQVIPASHQFVTSIEFLPEAAEELVKLIQRLPDHDAINHALGITVCGRSVQFVVKAPGGSPTAEVAVPTGRVGGKEVTIFLNRRYLAKALRFGLSRLEIIDALSPLRFSHGGRELIVMPTRPDTAAAPRPIPPAASTAPTNPAPSPPSAEEQPRKGTQTMPEHTNGNGSVPAAAASRSTSAENGHDDASERPALETALEQAESVRADFRNAIADLNKLVDALKAAQREQKSQQKEISSVRQTLRSLQSVRI